MAEFDLGASGQVSNVAGGISAASGFTGPAAPFVAAAGFLTSLAGSFVGGPNRSAPGAAYLPPEYDVALIRASQDQLKQINANYAQITQLGAIFNQRMDLLNKAAKGLIPPATLTRSLTLQSAQIAKAFGGDVQTAIKNGFMTPQDQADLANLRKAENQDFTDPTLERQLTTQKAQLEQELRRQGVGPAQRLRALQDFDQYATESRFSRKNELLNELQSRTLGRVGASVNARTAGYNIAAGEYGALNANLEQTSRAINFSANLAGNQLAGNQSVLGVQGALRQETLNNYRNLGTYNFNNETRDLLQTGNIGPGTVYSQTGIPRALTEDVKGTIAGQEVSSYNRASGKTVSPIFSTSPRTFQY